MKALTVFQPWASLIMAGAKPYEFRRHDYRTRDKTVENQRIVVHAAARPMRMAEIVDILDRLATGQSSLKPEIARPLLARLADMTRDELKTALPLAHGLGTAVIGTPRRVDALFKSPDSDRIDHHMYAWPLTDIRHFEPPVPMRGFQGFWTWPERIAA